MPGTASATTSGSVLRSFWPYAVLGCLAIGMVSCSEDAYVAPPWYLPKIDELIPAMAAFDDTDVVVTVVGRGFIEESVVQWNDEPLTTTYVDDAHLLASLRDEDLARPADADNYTEIYASIHVSNRSAGGGLSPSRGFVVRTANPTPTLVDLDPSLVIAGSGSRQLLLHGTGFRPESLASWNGQRRECLFYSDSLLSMRLSRDDLAIGGQFDVAVVTPPPGGGTTDTLVFSVVYPAPTYQSHNPVDLPAGRGAQTLTVQGTGFIPGTVVFWNDRQLLADYVFSGELQVEVPASALAAPDGGRLIMANPEPGGGQTEAAVIGVYLEIGADVQDIAYDSWRDVLYVAMGSEGGDLANTVATVDPAACSVLATLAAGTDPDVLALSDDGQYLYVGLNGDGAIRRHDLLGAGDLVFPVWDPDGGAPKSALDLVPLAGRPRSVAASVTDRYVMIYDDGVPRPVPGPTDGDNLYLFNDLLEATSDPAILISASRDNGWGLKKIHVTPEGAFVNNTSHDFMIGATPLDLQIIGGRVYTGAGLVYDEALTRNFGRYGVPGYVAADPTAGKAVILSGFHSTAAAGLVVFDLTNFSQLGRVSVERSDVNNGRIYDGCLVKVGRDGMAFITPQRTMRLYRDPLFGPAR